MRRALTIVAAIVGLYALAYLLYVVKSAAGIDLIPGVHHGSWFPGTDRLRARLHRW